MADMCHPFLSPQRVSLLGCSTACPLISQEHWTVADLLFEDDIFTQPRHEFVEGELASFVERKHEILRPPSGGRELCAVDHEKRIGGGKGGAFIAVEERVVYSVSGPSETQSQIDRWKLSRR